MNEKVYEKYSKKCLAKNRKANSDLVNLYYVNYSAIELPRAIARRII